MFLGILMKLKILNYNILHGFYPYDLSISKLLDTKRLKAVQEIIKLENPDIVVFTEACFAQNNIFNIKMDYPRLFDFKYHFHANVIHASIINEWGSSLLSKFPIKEAENYSMKKRGLLRAVLDIKGTLVNIDVLHPHPKLSENEKARFMKNCLRDIKNPYILVGDLNAISPQDNYNKTKLIKGFNTFQDNAEGKINDFMKFSVIKEILNVGLKDTFKVCNKKFDFTIPTDYLSKNKDSGIRIDYIFCSKEFKVLDAKIIKNELTNRASDHYPVTALLEI